MQVSKVEIKPKVVPAYEYVVTLSEEEIKLVKDNLGLVAVPSAIRMGVVVNEERVANLLAFLHRMLKSAGVSKEWNISEDGERYK